MRVCCSTGGSYENLTFYEKLGLCCGEHCVGPIEVEDYDLLLTGLGTFNTNDCTSSGDLCKLLVKADTWEEWMLSQIEQEGVEKYKAWYARMFQRGAVCDELIEAHNKLFGGE
jgi:hypothetical protein